MSPTRPLLLLFAVLALVTVLPAQKGTQEPRTGLECKPPKGWVALPAGGDRGATQLLLAAPRAIAGRGEGASHTPLLRVMFFQKGGDASKDVVDGLPRKTPFRSLEDFAQRGLGTSKVKVEQKAQKAGAFDGQRLTATIGEGEDNRMLIGQTVARDDGECAVCFELFTNQADKLKKEIEGTLDSLADCPRAAATGVAVPQWIAEPKSWAGMDAATRSQARRKWAEEVVAATAKAPEAGFKVSKSKYWTVLSAADAGYTKKAIAAAEAARAWCAQKMPDLAKDPLPAVLRVFGSPEQFRAFQSTGTDTREYSAARRELFCFYDPSDSSPSSFGPVCRAVLWQLFDDVDPGVLPAMPRWFDNGCWSFMNDVKCEGKKIEFFVGVSEKGRIESQLRQNGLPQIWDLIQELMQPSPADGANEKSWEYIQESARVMRWFWLADGEKAIGKAGFVADYVRGLGTTFGKVGPDPTADVAVVELDKDAQKKFNTGLYAWRDGLLKQHNEAVVPFQRDTWDAQWKALNEKWHEYVKSSK